LLRDSLVDPGRLYNFSALDVYTNITKCVEKLGLPHSAHAHVEGYEQEQGKSNLFVVLNKIKDLNLKPSPKSSFNLKRSQVFHIAHGSSYCIDGNNADLIKFLNENQTFDLDLGFIGFDEINPLITSDRRVISVLPQSNEKESSRKLVRSSVEFEGEFFVSIRSFAKSNESDCILWANALELALGVNNKWQLQLSFNFPNYSNITNVPEIATWLMSAKARNDFMIDMNEDFLKTTALQNNAKTLTFNDFVILTRASPANSLGLGNIKGNLGPGAEADINVLDINLSEIDSEKDYEQIKEALSKIEYVIKAGKIVKNQDLIDSSPQGRIFWSEGKIDNKDAQTILSKKREFYQKYSSMYYESYKISIDNKYLKKID
jgi:formylmethanofuran dehydrogenase subunit A